MVLVAAAAAALIHVLHVVLLGGVRSSSPFTVLVVPRKAMVDELPRSSTFERISRMNLGVN